MHCGSMPHMINTEVDIRCRMCNEKQETTDYSECNILLASGACTNRHM